MNSRRFPLAPYCLSFSIPILVLAGLYLEGAWTFAAPLFLFGFLPLAEHFLGTDGPSPDETAARSLREDRRYSYLLWLHVPVQFACLLLACSIVGSKDLSPIEVLGNLLSVGIMSGGIAINVAHELIHRPSRFEQNLGKALLLSSCYMHFFIEHVRGHHRNVATDGDPASARLGESFYTYYPRSVLGSYVSAWRLESQRLQGEGRKPLSAGNQMIQFTAINLGFAGVLLATLGPSGLLFYLGSSWVGFTLLEAVNYLEHYGLQRQESADGALERVDIQHSWNSNYYLSRWFLFELTRHSDHHMHASRKYQTLRNLDDSPQLPSGYPAMILLALLPPIWRKVMDPKVLQVRD